MREPQVGEPVRSLQTFLRKIAQRNTKIPLVIPDGLYTRQTYDAVSGFQGEYGLPVTGVTDFDTWKKIVEIYDEIPKTVHMPDVRCLFPESNYRITANESADCLFLIQAMMTVINNNHPHIGAVEISGTHTPDSMEAVKNIQTAAGLEPNGVIDIHTYNAIVTMYNSVM